MNSSPPVGRDQRQELDRRTLRSAAAAVIVACVEAILFSVPLVNAIQRNDLASR